MPIGMAEIYERCLREKQQIGFRLANIDLRGDSLLCNIELTRDYRQDYRGVHVGGCLGQFRVSGFRARNFVYSWDIADRGQHGFWSNSD